MTSASKSFQAAKRCCAKLSEKGQLNLVNEGTQNILHVLRTYINETVVSYYIHYGHMRIIVNSAETCIVIICHPV